MREHDADTRVCQASDHNTIAPASPASRGCSRPARPLQLTRSSVAPARVVGRQAGGQRAAFDGVAREQQIERRQRAPIACRVDARRDLEPPTYPGGRP